MIIKNKVLFFFIHLHSMELICKERTGGGAQTIAAFGQDDTTLVQFNFLPCGEPYCFLSGWLCEN